MRGAIFALLLTAAQAGAELFAAPLAAPTRRLAPDDIVTFEVQTTITVTGAIAPAKGLLATEKKAFECGMAALLNTTADPVTCEQVAVTTAVFAPVPIAETVPVTFAATYMVTGLTEAQATAAKIKLSKNDAATFTALDEAVKAAAVTTAPDYALTITKFTVPVTKMTPVTEAPTPAPIAPTTPVILKASTKLTVTNVVEGAAGLSAGEKKAFECGMALILALKCEQVTVTNSAVTATVVRRTSLRHRNLADGSFTVDYTITGLTAADTQGIQEKLALVDKVALNTNMAKAAEDIADFELKLVVATVTPGASEVEAVVSPTPAPTTVAPITPAPTSGSSMLGLTWLGKLVTVMAALAAALML